jgi:hypothetical protein
MERIFQPTQFFALPDGTEVAPLVNPWDRNASGVPHDCFAGASVALGQIAPGAASSPHLHPLVTQLTWLLEGALRVRMKGERDAAPYELDLTVGQGALTEPMTFLQLVNRDAARPARVLYVVTPAYVYLPGVDGYDDAVVFDRTWDALARAGFPTDAVGRLDAVRARRARAMARMRAPRG